MAAKKAVKKAAKKPSASGDPVATYYAKLPGWQRELAERIDAIVRREVPGVKAEIKWNVPNYGTDAKGWFCACAGFSKHVKVNFFRGASLSPPPPAGTGKEMRSIDYRDAAELDEKRLVAWIRQAAAMPGMGA
ncbi:MAG: hypothetical protein QOE90_1872 [Thermoplasmata archaeon]|jgi:hypothetical protein|nr:hypothetical protein [Thermoplasmata archaeon]